MADTIINYTIRIPRQLKEAAKKQAKKEGRSLNSHFVYLLEQSTQGNLITVSDLCDSKAVIKLLELAIKKASDT